MRHSSVVLAVFVSVFFGMSSYAEAGHGDDSAVVQSSRLVSLASSFTSDAERQGEVERFLLSPVWWLLSNDPSQDRAVCGQVKIKAHLASEVGNDLARAMLYNDAAGLLGGIISRTSCRYEEFGYRKLEELGRLSALALEGLGDEEARGAEDRKLLYFTAIRVLRIPSGSSLYSGLIYQLDKQETGVMGARLWNKLGKLLQDDPDLGGCYDSDLLSFPWGGWNVGPLHHQARRHQAAVLWMAAFAQDSPGDASTVYSQQIADVLKQNVTELEAELEVQKSVATYQQLFEDCWRIERYLLGVNEIEHQVYLGKWKTYATAAADILKAEGTRSQNVMILLESVRLFHTGGDPTSAFGAAVLASQLSVGGHFQAGSERLDQ